MDLLDAILASVLPPAAGCGLLLLSGVPPRLDRLAWFGWAIMAGFLATAVILWIALAFALPLEPGWMRLVLGTLAAAGAVVRIARRGRAPAPAEPARSASAGARVAMAASILLALAVVTETVVDKMLAPVIEEDEATNWASKGKELFLARGFNDHLARNIDLGERLLWVRAWHPDYPNFVPLLHTWMYVNAGRIVHYESRIPALMFRYALVLGLAGALWRRHRGLLTGLLIVPAVWFVSDADQGADVVVAFGLLVSVDAVTRSLDSGDRRWWRLAALGVTVLVGAKQDGTAMALSLGAAVLLHVLLERGQVPRPGREALWLIGPAAVLASTAWFNRRFETASSMLVRGSDGMTLFERAWALFSERLPVILGAIWKGMAANGSASRVLHVAFLLLLLASLRVAFARPMRVLTVTILLSWAALTLTFMGTPYKFDWHIHCTLVRVMDQWAPAIALWIALLFRTPGLPDGTRTETMVSSAAAARRARGARLRTALASVAILAALPGPLVEAWKSDKLRRTPQLVELMSKPEPERLAWFLGPATELYTVLREHSPESRPVVLILPPFKHQGIQAYMRFTALLFPKLVVPYFMDVGDISEFLDGYRLEYANTLEGILELTGPDVDVLVEPGTEMPLGLDFEPTHPRRHFILGRGRIRPDVIEAARQAEEERAESRRAETRRIAEERAATRKAAAESRRAEAQRLAAERAATRRTASQPASRPR